MVVYNNQKAKTIKLIIIIIIKNTIGNLYTYLHNYCRDLQFFLKLCLEGG